MKLNDYDEGTGGRFASGAAALAVLLIVSVIIIVLVANKDYLKRKFGSDSSSVATSVSETSAQASSSTGASNSEVFVSDLSFYKDYEDRASATASTSSASDTSVTTSATATTPELTEVNDGKHTLITNLDGTTEWAVISPHIPKCEYDYTNLFDQNGRFKYFENDKCTSYFGIDVSKDNNYIDYNKVKKDGVSFVMIRLGARGYQTGQLSIDDYYRDNIKRATDAGLDVGVYFMSQAVTEDEARQEAQCVIDNLLGYSISYPVALVMQPVKNDTARSDALSKKDRTTVIRAFLKAIKDKGYVPIVYGDKRWLFQDIDLSKIVGDFDIWLTETGVDYPDYPYKYAMWQYNFKGSVDGVSGDVNFNISFVDYALK
ncbi:MAG: hypothetical protein K5679_11300 [Lachnospiraceae bacterium]|nr:hypothetical protein [Lachnospiraceae bacterium]